MSRGYVTCPDAASRSADLGAWGHEPARRVVVVILRIFGRTKNLPVGPDVGVDNNHQSLRERLRVPSIGRPVMVGGVVSILGIVLLAALFGSNTGPPSTDDAGFAINSEDQTATTSPTADEGEPGAEPDPLIVGRAADQDDTPALEARSGEVAIGSDTTPTDSNRSSATSGEAPAGAETPGSDTTAKQGNSQSDTTADQASEATAGTTTTSAAARATTTTTRGSATTSAPSATNTSPSTTSGPKTTTASPGSPGSMPAYGFSPGGWFPDEPDAAMHADLDQMVAAGAGWLRIDFDWSEIEHNKGVYHWHRTDRVIDAASARGLKVLGLIGEAPGWARPAGLGSNAPPVDPADYARFAAAATERYRNRGVEAWELWNEPNLGMFWAPEPDPEAYANLVRPAVTAMRTVDPQVVIISGGLAPAADEPDGTGISPTTFTQRMLDAGADIFDGYAIHPYSYPARPIDPSTSAWNPFNNLPAFRDLLQRNGEGGKPIWLTEYGAPTGTSNRAVTQAEQSAQITEALIAADGWSWTGPLFLYSHRDERNAPGDFQMNFGLRFNNGSPKQAWTDLLAMANG